MTIAYYNGGVRVVDLSGLTGISLGTTSISGEGMKEIGYYRDEDGDSWSAKTPQIEPQTATSTCTATTSTAASTSTGSTARGEPSKTEGPLDVAGEGARVLRRRCPRARSRPTTRWSACCRRTDRSSSGRQPPAALRRSRAAAAGMKSPPGTPLPFARMPWLRIVIAAALAGAVTAVAILTGDWWSRGIPGFDRNLTVTRILLFLSLTGLFAALPGVVRRTPPIGRWAFAGVDGIPRRCGCRHLARAGDERHGQRRRELALRRRLRVVLLPALGPQHRRARRRSARRCDGRSSKLLMTAALMAYAATLMARHGVQPPGHRRGEPGGGGVRPGRRRHALLSPRHDLQRPRRRSSRWASQRR